MNLKKRTKETLIKRTEGMISILLVLLLVPFYSVAAILAEVGRFQNAYRGLDNSIGASEVSVLAQNDTYLMSRFGLLAVDQNIDIKRQFDAYLKKQDTQDTRSFSIRSTGTKAEGVYPLADVAIMRQQIEELAKVLVPAKVVMDVGDFTNIVSQLESYSTTFSNVNKMLTSIESSLQGGLDSYNAQKEAKKQMDKVASSTKKYKDDYPNFEKAMTKLKEHLDTPRPEDEEGAAKWDKEKEDLIQKAQEARDGYRDTVNKESQDISKLAEKMDTAVDKEASAKDAIIGNVTTFGDLTNDSINKELTDKKKKVDEQSKKDWITKNEKDNMSSVSNKLEEKTNRNDNIKKITDAAIDGAKRSDEVKDTLEDYNSEACKGTLQDLHDEIAELDKINFDNITSDDIDKIKGKLNNTDISKFEDPKKFNDLWKETKNAVEGGALGSTSGDTLEALIEIINVDASYDPELDSKIDTTYYANNFGGLPSGKKRSLAEYSLDSEYESSDAELAKKNLYSMGLEVQNDDGTFSSYGSDSTDSTSTETDPDLKSNNIFKKLIAVTKNLKNKVSSVGNMFTAMTEIGKKMSEGFLLKGYLAYSLSNRVNYSSGSSLVGQAYSSCGGLMAVDKSSSGTEWSQLGEKLVDGVTAGLVDIGGRTGYSFCGAELEYVMFGKMSEKENQKAAYNRLLLLHFLMSLLKVPSNAFVKSATSALAAACAAVPGMPAVVEMFMPIVFSYANGVIDAIRICNGDSVALFKTDDDLNVTPSGLVKAINKLTSLKVTTSKNAEKDLNGALNKLKNLNTSTENNSGSTALVPYTGGSTALVPYTGGSTALVPYDNNTALVPTTNGGEKKEGTKLIDPKKYKDSIRTFDYSEYMFIMLLLFWNNESELLNRFADIIQMEQTNRNNTMNNTQYTLEEQIGGKKRKFDIDKAYTTIRADVSGKFVNVLPVPTLSRKTSWSVRRMIYRGY